MKLYIFTTLLALAVCIGTANAQNTPLSAEDSLNLTAKNIPHTSIGGYGNAVYTHDFYMKHSTVTLERFVLFTGHQFTKKISFFSELEMENAKVVGGEPGGEISIEQSYLKFSLDAAHYLVAGLFLPRIGILNENHLPTQFASNERNRVETVVLPSTWRELGVGFYGNASQYNITYSLGLVNGLNSAGFRHGTMIREGRFEGQNATANNIAVTGSLQWYKSHFKAQISGYYGGSVGLSSRGADSLQLQSGFFGTPVAIGEADIQYAIKGWHFAALGALVNINNAYDINRAYANNTPQQGYGAYVEASYNILENFHQNKNKQFLAFLRYERLNLNSKLPANGIIDPTLNEHDIETGLCYMPTPNIALKADVRLLHTGEQNPALIINPNPTALPYSVNNTFLNIGIGYSF